MPARSLPSVHPSSLHPRLTSTERDRKDLRELAVRLGATFCFHCEASDLSFTCLRAGDCEASDLFSVTVAFMLIRFDIGITVIGWNGKPLSCVFAC